MRNWFFALSRGKQIAYSVLALHALLVVVLASESWLRRAVRPAKMAVRTVQLSEPPRQPVVRASVPEAPTGRTAAPVAPAAPVGVVKPAAPEPKRTAAPKAVVAPTAPQKPKPAAKPKANQQVTQHASQQAELLSEIQNTLREIAKPTAPAPQKPQLAIPSLQAPVAVPQPLETPQGVEERIGAFLQEMLQLPEFGEVKVKLSIDARGRLTDFKILEAKSEKNAEFLKNRLPELQFPCFNESSLTVVFRNA